MPANPSHRPVPLLRLLSFGVLVLVAVWLAQRALYLPHVDDLFVAAWARTIANGDQLPVHALSRFLPEPGFFEIAPKAHILLLASYFKVFEDPVEAILALRVTLFLAAAAIIALRVRSMPMAAVFFPLLLGIVMLHTGLRWEGTALALLLGGTMLLHGTEPAYESSMLVRRIIAKSLIILAPLAAPSALAYGAGILIVADLRRLSRRTWPVIAIEGALALAIGILALGAMAGFDYARFLSVYSRAGEGNVLMSLAPMRAVNGIVLLAAALLLRRRAPRTAWIAAGIGLGACLSAFLHNKISISVPLTWLALLIVVDEAATDARLRRALWIGTAAGIATLYVNQVQFAFASRASPEANAAVLAFAEQARAETRPLLVDEIAAIHGLGLDLRDAYAWSWAVKHPGHRPGSVHGIAEGESWIVSTYTVHGWLRSRGVEGFPVQPPAAARALKATPCLVGRNSCRLPRLRWSYYLVERRNGKVTMKIQPGGEDVRVPEPHPVAPTTAENPGQTNAGQQHGSR